jgi:putative hemolysin
MHGRAGTPADSYIEVSDDSEVSEASPWPLGTGLPVWVSRLLGRVSGIEALERLRRDIPGNKTPTQFAAAALQKLAIDYRHDPAELERVPRTGRLIFIANHPFGALDGLIALALLGVLRPDLKMFASADLRALRELEPMLLPIEVFGRKRANCNARAMRNALRWLEQEGALMVFPAGEVSHFDARARCVTDPPWSRAVALLARKARADIIPVHFTGENGLPFQIAGFLHPRLRSLLLPGELKRRVGSSVPVRIGSLLPSERLRTFASDEALAAHLRVTTYLLARHQAKEPAGVGLVAPRRAHPLALSGAPADVAGEVARLPATARLIDAGDHAIYCAESDAIPHLLEEIGRLRELTFRAAGEGTGRARDLDSFDEHYEHLVLWNRQREEVVGAYRVGRIDEICKRAGRRGLYTAGLFRYRDPFFRLLGPALELGRSFVRPEAQRSFAPLLTLWKGIGEYLARHPSYFRLLGPVSISSDYQELSRQLLVEFLRSHCLDPLLAQFVRPAHPVPRGRLVRTVAAEVAMLGHLDALGALVEDIEPDRKGVPILLRQYLKLGGRMLAFNVDPAFNQSIDCLLMVDVRQSDPRVLRRYLPEPAVARIATRAPRFPGIRTAG